MLVCLVLAAAVGYGSVDYGIYRTTVITVADAEGLEDGDYKLSELITFTEYMRLNLGSSSVKKEYGDDSIEMGATATTISYFADLGGAAVGALVALGMLRKKYPYCRPCRKYKQREREYVIQFVYEEQLASAVLGGINERITAGDYAAILSHVQELSQTHADGKGDVQVCVDHRLCPGCGAATLLGKVQRLLRAGFLQSVLQAVLTMGRMLGHWRV